MEDIRWQQRLENFSKSLRLLEKGINQSQLDELQRAGLVQFFEMAFELSWKMMKDYLQSQGFQDIRSPRDAIKKTFEIGLLSDGKIWLKGLEDRNLTAHTYNEKTAEEVDLLIRDVYYPRFIELERTFTKL
ncbi:MULTISPECIES: nucleotidyltransferase substrate binding protein [unclassified Oceanispirochaeta]|uniref:nucleotidyltransferase substrate binding protein n=1 Tax=unclassified Oceanispirochaeta TaxID=2635722 RepID=UPI000E090EE1|nr:MULTISPECIES: nucleotidyltransferase substrate binding protein [unclassified Oceanispirochaeta]MBF9018007.1 nucleotidyltransferase substrate binding protein [Oceanispirochaeta sp. M2]NPD74519.1 nucleotidyltransferase [Oceanispirochaeta sp. M1]RDG29632.1 nucleotidyltransferase [Oceanispirochaeta sp. M1]